MSALVNALVDLSKSQNDLLGIQEQILNEMRLVTGNSSRSSNTSKGIKNRINSTNSNQTFDFTSLSETVGDFMSFNNSNAIPDLANGLGSVIGQFGPMGTAFELIIQTGTELYKYMNEQLQQYINVNEAGLRAEGGMLGLSKAAARSRMDLDDFSSVLIQNSEYLAGFGSTAPMVLGDLMSSFREMELTNGQLNIQNKELAQTVVDYMSTQKTYGLWDAMTKAQQRQGLREYIEELNEMSQVLGKSRRELSEGLRVASEKLDGMGTVQALINKGYAEAQAQAITNAINAGLDVFGEQADFLQQMIHKRIRGKALSDSERQIAAVSGLMSVINDVAGQAQQGLIEGAEGAKIVQDLVQKASTETQMRLTQAEFVLGEQANVLTRFHAAVRRSNKQVQTAQELSDEFWDTAISSMNNYFSGFISELTVFGIEGVNSIKFFVDNWDFVWEDMLNWVRSNFTKDNLVKWGGMLLSSLLDSVSNTLSMSWGMLLDALGGIIELTGAAAVGLFGDKFGAEIENIYKGIADSLYEFSDFLPELFDKMRSKIPEWLGGLSDEEFNKRQQERRKAREEENKRQLEMDKTYSSRRSSYETQSEAIKYNLRSAFLDDEKQLPPVPKSQIAPALNEYRDQFSFNKPVVKSKSESAALLPNDAITNKLDDLINITKQGVSTNNKLLKLQKGKVFINDIPNL
ncbi:hypothetical protein [Endozoicomonas sp. SCSIO W0465]|uniref:hypothetical protein n=1 Tax=Endozoicomonas sp. SCSIO W0465 TaxID=2918516 RepID=UPI002074F558|nr:hypothetical protein [Endozoicomonas sp. SCSIO W0465]USE39525.1 hypothetical protein MJO57_15985 [Endozoicomonas sp. SCSIO W0465]